MNSSPPIPPWANIEASDLLPILCERGEGQAIEFKEKLPEQGHGIAKSIAAFASSNDGYLLVGVSNDGSIVGLPGAESADVRDNIKQRIVGFAKTVRPPTQPSIAWAYHKGAVVCVVSIKKGERPLYYSNERPIVRRENISRPAEPDEVEHLVRSGTAPINAQPVSLSSRAIGKRIEHVLDLMNYKRSEPWTFADLALAMKLISPNDLDAVVTGKLPASFELVDRFCERFAVNKDWLIAERNSPFASSLEIRYLPEDYLDLMDRSQPKTVYAVRSRSQTGEAFFVVESDPLKYWIFPSYWHVSSQVGGGGSLQLFSLYKVFKRWIASERPYLVLGRYLESELARSVINGEVYPGIVARSPLSNWWDDLTDIEHKWTSRKDLTEAYGREFVAAQDIIRKML